MKRLAKLEGSSTNPTSTPVTPSSSSSAPSPAPSPKPKHRVSPILKPAAAPTTPTQLSQKRKAPTGQAPFNYDVWGNETIGQVFLVTLDVCLPNSPGFLLVWLLIIGGKPAESMKSNFEYVWLRSAVENLSSDGMLHLHGLNHLLISSVQAIFVSTPIIWSQL